MIYPANHRVQWRADIPPRCGAQAGTLTREWDRYESFPQIMWDGEECVQQCLPECITPEPLSITAIVQQPGATSSKNAWAEYKPKARRGGR